MEKHSYLYPHSTNGIMKDFQLHKTISIFLLIGFSLLSSEQVKSQLINCDQMTAFLGDATTLCETYPSFTPTITLGNGINNASQVGTSLSGNILIVGDFKIDQNFTFSNAIIKINNNVKIIVQSSFISFDIGYSNLNNKRIKLTINNSKLFACSGLWKGIQMTSFTDLILNDVQIEDAQKAVNAINTFAVTLDIRYTTFNRNQYGIYLSNTPFYVFDPVFRRFIQNNFYCTSPINGTDEGASNAGIYLENITASLIAPVIYQYTHFEDQFIGVQLVGSQTTLKASLFVFGRCWNEGILMDNGSSLELDNSTFNEVNFRGIYGKKFKNLTLIQCHFNTEDLDNQRALDCQFVFLESMPNGGKILIDDSDFETMDALEGKQIEGITILAPTNGANVEMAVTECNFDLEAGKVRGIFLSGAFPESSNFSIENNYFDIRRNNGADVTESAIGLYSYGNKNNLRIHNNQFTGNNFFCTGISIEITNGIWNEISGNEFIGGYVNLLASIPRLNSGLYLRSAQNITVCDNTDYFTCDAAFRFYKSCLNTNFTLNTMYAGGASLTLFQVGSVISEQYQAGNKFIPVVVSIFGTNFSYPPSAVCEDYAVASLSLFTVHKPQSFWDDVAQDWDPLEIYHPWKVTPDSDIYTDAFFVDPPDDMVLRLLSVN